MAQAQAGRAAARSAEVFELKSASLSLLSLVLKSADPAVLAAELQARLGDTPEVFNHDPLLIDLSQLQRPAAASAPAEGAQVPLGLDEAVPQPLDLAAVVALLRRHRMQPVAVQGATAAELEQAQALGLAEAPEDEPGAAPRTEPAPVAEAPATAATPAAAEASAPARTLIIDKPLRSGQQVYAKGADLVVLALVNHGAEVIADGNIHVYAPLRGKAIAGARGNSEARIFAASLEAELIAIAGIYRTTENPLPETVLGKPAQVRLDGEKLVMEALKL
ncbi:septum site-determining protein MinC [Roseateles violae]|uniref:Probable septum site-determining protein MinC n=1 Tax=Roseateles violae TaxID=3058042 RepID=A0ABT8DU49_9BURK|nr:septum site-determining protein MinC [Pelomonas sp. PFR6]MDN3919844.1 septum site-determining protein MinC [Pelomonas sp. PFR6]